MEQDDAVAALGELGFTRLEGEVYTFLLQESPATGYRVAQALARPVANTYKAIQSLERKGAVLVDEGANRLCRAVPAEELLRQMERGFAEKRGAAARALSRLRGTTEDTRVYQLRTPEAIFERCRAMLDAGRRIVLVDVFPALLEPLRADLERTAARGVEVHMKLYQPDEVRGAEAIITAAGDRIMEHYPGHWLIVNVDGAEHLVAFFSPDRTSVLQAVWTGSAFLSHIQHSGMAAELVLTDLLRNPQAGVTPAECRQAVYRARHLFALDSPGYQTLLRQFGGYSPAAASQAAGKDDHEARSSRSLPCDGIAGAGDSPGHGPDRKPRRLRRYAPSVRGERPDFGESPW